MHLVRDLLDNQIVDRNHCRLGKIDGIVIELREGEPPLLRYLETGWAVKVRRVHPRLAHGLRRWLSPPYRIDWDRVSGVGVDVEVDLDAAETPLLRTEERLRRFLKRIPGA